MASVLTLTKLEVRVRFPSPVPQTCDWAVVIGQTILPNSCMQEGASGDRGSFYSFSAYITNIPFISQRSLLYLDWFYSTECARRDMNLLLLKGLK